MFDPDAGKGQSAQSVDQSPQRVGIGYETVLDFFAEQTSRRQRSASSESHGSDTASSGQGKAVLHTPVLLPYAASEDCHRLQHYLEVVEPSISGITPYQDFWGVTVPQVAWHDSAIRHLISAMSIRHNEMTGSRRGRELMNDRMVSEQCNLAISDWNQQINSQNSISSALVLSRILSLIDYVGGDFELSKMHRRHCTNIARQTLADDGSDLASRSLAETMLQMNLSGPGFLADEDAVVRMVDETRMNLLSKQQQTSLRKLKIVRHDFEDWLFSTSRSRWLQLPGDTRFAILNAWGLMNRTIGSLFNGESTPNGDEVQKTFRLILAARIERAYQSIECSGAVLYAGEADREDGLIANFKDLRDEIDALSCLDDRHKYIKLVEATQGIRRLTDLFLVYAAGILQLADGCSSTVLETD